MSDTPTSVISFDPESGRRLAVFRISGFVRFIPAAFLLVWLCGWLVGEVFAGGTLLYMAVSLVSPETARRFSASVTTPSGMVGLAIIGFLLLWLFFWTLGGIAAGRELLRMLWSEDRLSWDGMELRREERVGPFRGRRTFPAAEIRAIRLHARDGALVLARARDVVTLTRLGTREQRLEVCDALRAVFASAPVAGSELPIGWDATPDEHGAMVLVRDRVHRPARAAIMWALAGLAGAGLAYGIYLTATQPTVPGTTGGIVMLGFLFLGLATGASWYSHGGSAIAIGAHWVEFRRHWAHRRWIERVQQPILRVERTVDSDGDEHANLVVVGDAGRRRGVASAMNSHAEIVMLARWIAARSGVKLEVAREFEDAA
jgi:hypothetical protein